MTFGVFNDQGKITTTLGHTGRVSPVFNRIMMPVNTLVCDKRTSLVCVYVFYSARINTDSLYVVS